MNEITSDKLQEIIGAGESETVEFKESFNDEALEAVGAFANARGGSVVIGVKNSGEICGFQIGKKTLEDIANRIQDTTDPRLQPSILVSHFDKMIVLVIRVTTATGVPISVRGRYFRRVGRSNQRMSHEEIMQRMIASNGLSWDAILETRASLEDLDFDKVNQFIQMLKNKGRFSIPERASDQEVLRKLKLIDNGIPTRASLLLFGKDTDNFFPAAFLKLGRFRSLTHIVDDREVHGTLVDQLDGAMSWFRERLETEFIITGKPQRDVHWEYPLEAIREAVTNILSHRDYTSLAHSQIRLYDDRLEFWNAGGLPPQLTPEALFYEHDSMPRNRKIAECFYYAGLIERWGSGTIRMIEELEIANLPIPQFKSASGNFRLIFSKHSKKDVLAEANLSERQLKAVEYVKEHGFITNSIYQTITGVSERTATRDLNGLKLKQLLVSEGITGRGTIYKLKTP